VILSAPASSWPPTGISDDNDVLVPRIEVTSMSTTLTTIKADDLFTAWIGQSPARQRTRGRRPRPSPGRLRFAFYGRISTTGYQDPASSRQWQHDNATRLTAGHGTIVTEYFDTGYSRSLPWHPEAQRSQAAARRRAAGPWL
jgi:hypothetical protein